MRAKVLVNVDRQAALNAIHAIDAPLNEDGWPKKLRKKYAQTRDELVSAIGQWGIFNGVVELPE